MLRIHPILLIVIFASLVFSDSDEIGEVEIVKGAVTINPAQKDIIPGVAIAGRMLHNRDIVHTGEDGLIKFNLNGEDGQITMSGFSELQFKITNQSCQMELKYGDIFTDFPTASNCEIITYSDLVSCNSIR